MAGMFDSISPMVGAMSGLSGALGLAKSGYGLYQLLTNKEPERPTYKMPTQLNQILGISRFMASQRGLPGQDLMQRNLASNTAANVRAVQETTTGGAGLGAVNQAFGNQQNAQTQLDIAGAGAYQQNLQGLQQSLGMIANAKDQEFEYNQNMPYQRALQNYYQTRMAGVANLFGGFGDVSGAAGILAQNQQGNQMMNILYGNGQQGGQQFTPEQQAAIKQLLGIVGTGTQFVR